MAGNFIQIVRDVSDVMVSCYRLRERFGIATEINFSEFVRTPYSQMPRTTSCNVSLNGKTVTAVAHHLLGLDTTPLEYWLWLARNHHEHAALTVRYAELIKDSASVMRQVASLIPCRLVDPNVRPTQRVGFWPLADQRAQVLREDVELMRKFQDAYFRSEVANAPQSSGLVQ